MDIRKNLTQIVCNKWAIIGLEEILSCLLSSTQNAETTLYVTDERKDNI